VVTVLAVVITFFVMAPVAQDIMERTTVPAASDAEKGDDRRMFADALAVYDAASPPLLDFLRANTTREEINHYQKLAREDAKQPAGARVLLMAFASSEFVEAVTVGFLVLLPFVLIDLLVAHVLLAAGLMNLPAAVVALPLKLLLFIAADGWRLITDALVMSYRV